MQRREKILAITLAAALGIFVVVPKVWSWFNEPVEDLQNQRTVAMGGRDKKSNDLDLALAKQRRVGEWKSRSLSPLPDQGKLQYQQWLTDLAEVVAEFSNLQVIPEASAAAANMPYVVIHFRLSGEATLAQLRLFLFRFLQADLLHAVTQINLESPTTSGNPRLKVNMKFEALSLPKLAPPRGPTLFPRTEVAEDWSDPAELLNVQSIVGFPTQTPFVIRVGKNYFEVKETSGTSWKLTADLNSPRQKTGEPIKLRKDETVELVQIHPEFARRALDDFAPVLQLNPFVKPVVYAPKLEFVGSRTVSRGSSLELTCRASGFDLFPGEPTFELVGDAPDGLTLDRRSGKIAWTPSDEQPLGDMTIAVAVTAPGLKSTLTEKARLTLRQTNKAPTIESIGERQAVLGREFVLQVKATDDESEDRLRYSLSAGAPEGAKIDATTGELKWTPPTTFVPGPVRVSVQVTDAGSPPMNSTREFTIVVGDDLAQFTKLTGIVAVDAVMEARFNDLSSNKSIKLREGQTLRYADIEAKLEKIERRAVVFRKDDALWRLDLGDTLKNMKKLDAPTTAAPASTTPAPASTPATGTD